MNNLFLSENCSQQIVQCSTSQNSEQHVWVHNQIRVQVVLKDPIVEWIEGMVSNMVYVLTISIINQ